MHVSVRKKTKLIKSYRQKPLTNLYEMNSRAIVQILQDPDQRAPTGAL